MAERPVLAETGVRAAERRTYRGSAPGQAFMARARNKTDASAMIGDVELIQIIFTLGAEAYTGSIARAVRRRVGRQVHVGWLHMRLNRLKSLGLLKQEKDRQRTNGMRPKSFVRLTPKGEAIGRLGAEPGRAHASLRDAFN